MKKRLLLIAILALIALPVFAGSAGGSGKFNPDLFGLGAPLVLGTVINASTLIGLQKSFKALFREAYEAATPSWPNVAMLAPSNNLAENYQWLGDVPAMKEWLDEKSVEKLRGMTYLIVNKDWESTIGVDRNHIDDDQLGLYRPRILGLGDEAKRHPDELVSTARVAGSSSLAYDGQYFYDTDHVIGKSGTLSNIVTGTGVTLAQVTADFISGRARLRSFKTDRGKPFIKKSGRLKIVCTIPAALEGIFEQLANASFIATTENVLKGSFEYVVDNYLVDANDWYMDYVDAPIKPFVLQMRKEPALVAMDQPDAPNVFMKKEFFYGVEGRYNVGYAFWQYSIKVTNT